MPAFELHFRRVCFLLATGFLCVGCAPSSDEPAADGPGADSSAAVQSEDSDSAGDEVVVVMEEETNASDEKDASVKEADADDQAEPSNPTSEVAADTKSKSANSKPSLYSPEAFRNAAFEGKLRVIEVCLKDNLDVNEQDANGLTALAMAAYNGHTQVVKLLLKEGAKVSLSDRQGRTPLYHASSGPYPDAVKLLLAAGAKIDAVDSGEGFSALMVAAAEGNTEVVQVLLDAGADKSLADVDKDTALDFARKAGHAKIVKLLE